MSALEDLHPDPVIAMLAPKAVSAFDALEARYAVELTEPERDYLFARFVLGLTTPFYGEGEPALHLAACQTLLLQVLPSAEAARALESVPHAPADWAVKAFEAVEQIGLKGGRNLLKQYNRSS